MAMDGASRLLAMDGASRLLAVDGAGQKYVRTDNGDR
jgi:hypothetical protein